MKNSFWGVKNSLKGIFNDNCNIKKKIWPEKTEFLEKFLNICAIVCQVGTLFINVKFLKVFTFKGLKLLCTSVGWVVGLVQGAAAEIWMTDII